ncbi:related to tannase [Phialocephala subalpina]|uniref:Carboxylic ester hydrolase n=1 Tax=Phialocephala subalpina TaxID=576137 RepID=A0A1L7WLA2_9HELO|nr:related to tannase [Phialocephala subalpina]
MRTVTLAILTGALVVGRVAVCFAEWPLLALCNSSYIATVLPTDAYLGITINTSSLIVETVTNYTSGMSPIGTTYNFCNVNYWLPEPTSFKNRCLSTGGGALMINGGASGPSDGPVYGAISGRTDGGFEGFDNAYDLNGVDLLANGTINYDTLVGFGYLAIREMSVLGKAFTRTAMQMDNGTKLYSYYEGCSEGGREGWSQVQRFGDEWDGAAIGAPAFRYSFQQVNHLFSGVAMQTLGYTPRPCEFNVIVNATIADLCKTQRPRRTLEGSAHGAEPAQNGTVSAEAVTVANTIIDGLHDLQGKRVYLSYQPSATFADATPQYDNTTDSWVPSIDGVGGLYIVRILQRLELDALPSLEGVTYDTLRAWMMQGYQEYQDTLQVNWSDLSAFHSSGGKVIHYHGESDNSIPTASSVRYWDSVRKIMYPGQLMNDSADALGDWYRLFLVPGAGHCASNTLQPNGPYPATPLASVIAWVEDNVKPVMLNATATSVPYAGEQPLCAFPLRPYFTDNGETMIYEYDQDSIDSWLYEFDSIIMPVY